LNAAGIALGEAVFYTGMTGYEEALTDPSYAGQILAFHLSADRKLRRERWSSRSTRMRASPAR